MNASPDTGAQAGDSPLGDFADRLRTIGDRIPIAGGEPALAEIRHSLHTRHRRMRLVPIAAAAVVAATAISAAIVATGSDDATLTVSSEPSIGRDDSSAAQPTAADGRTTSTTGAASISDASIPSEGEQATGSGLAGVRTILVDTTVTEALRPEIVDAAAEDVTGLVPRPEQVRPEGLPDDVSYETDFEWLVEWQGGFLLGRESIEVAGALDVRFSQDGRSWQAIDVTPPGDWGSVHDIDSTGDRLVVLTNRWDGQRSEPAVWSTTDLVDWTGWAIPSDDPGDDFPASVPVRSQALGLEIVANDEGWAVLVRGDVEIDTLALAEDYVDADAAAIDSIGSTWDGDTLTLEIGEGDAEVIVEIDISEDLALDDHQVRTLEIGAYNEMWVGDWTEADPTLVADLPPGSFQGVAASDGALAGWTSTHIGVIANGDDTMHVFATRPAVAERSSITEVYTDGTDFIVHANAPSAAAVFDRLDPRSGEWTPLDLDPLPATVRAEYESDHDSAIMNPQSLPGSVATTASIDAGDYRYVIIFDSPFATYELRRLDTNEVVISETVDTRNGSDPRAPGWRFEIFDPSNNSVMDPQSGEVLVDLTDEQAGLLFSSQTTLDGEPAPTFTVADFTPIDFWLVSVTNGSWLLHDLPEPAVDENGNPRRPGRGLIERSGDILLVETGDGWLRFDV